MCTISGQCTFDLEAQRCKARDERDCRNANGCKTSGLCSFVKGYCMATKAEDCKASEQCAEAGRCSFKAEAASPCLAASDADCKGSAGCKRLGECSAAQGKCRVAKNDDCTDS